MGVNIIPMKIYMSTIKALEMREKGITVNSEDRKYECPVSLLPHLLHWCILSVRRSAVHSTLLAQQLKRLSVYDILYHNKH